MEDKNNRKTKLILGMIIAIIIILLAGIVYQFVCIKRLQSQIDQLTNAQILETSNKYTAINFYDYLP